METDYLDLKLDPIFAPIKKIFEFFILGIGFVGQKKFQKNFLESHPCMTPFVISYNSEVNLREEGSSVTSDAGLYWITIGRMMAISIWDIMRFSDYHNFLKKEEIYKFAKHIRNGAAHDNKFDINPPIRKPVTWRNKTIRKKK